jgi:hypothetical protein
MILADLITKVFRRLGGIEGERLYTFYLIIRTYKKYKINYQIFYLYTLPSVEDLMPKIIAYNNCIVLGLFHAAR